MGKSALVLFFTCILGAALAIDCNCPYNYDPVCGTDGVTYGNLCNLNCEATRVNNLKFLKYGECQPKEELCVCIEIYAPVCGSDGITYANQCEFECEIKNTHNFHLKIEYDGKCDKLKYQSAPKEEEKEVCFCNKMYMPVCGTDGITYGNSCELNCEAKITLDSYLTMKHDGECTSEDSCNCPKIFNPVCGSDGFTYSNECDLNCERTKPHNNNLKMEHYGGCIINDEICMCNKMYAPVCGTDAITYGNECEFQCEVKKTNNFHLKINYEGECDKKTYSNTPICPYIYAPVCASNRETFVNKCMFDNYVKETKNFDLKIAYNGECDERLYKNVAACKCPKMYLPVCASNGQTYDNKCMFDCFVSESHDINVRIVKAGRC